MARVVHRAGEGEALFGGRIVIKADFEQLSITESQFERARPGADPHIHRQHADSFYVLEGELAFLLDDEERQLGPGACICAPAGVVHGFRSTSPARFLNFHTPDRGFANNLRALERGEAGGFDSFDAQAGSGLPGANAILLHTGEGERLVADTRIATIKIGREELSLIAFELEPGFQGPEPHTHDDHVDAFYVLDGEVEFCAATRRSCSAAGHSWPRRLGSCTRSQADPGAAGCSTSTLRAPASVSGFGRTVRRAGVCSGGQVARVATRRLPPRRRLR